MTGYELMKTLEEEMSDKNCASICDYVPLFYVKKAVTDGSPKLTCTDAFLGEFEELDNFGKASIAQSVITLLAVIVMVVAAGPYGILHCYHSCRRL